MKLFAITTELMNTEKVHNSDFLLAVCQSTMAIYPAEGPPHPWVGYLAANGETYVCACAFKSVPDKTGDEIVYFTFPEFEGKGIATQMARELVAIAANGGVKARAQTLPKVSASTSILEKLGFEKVGSVIHPEDGEVWEWQQT